MRAAQSRVHAVRRWPARTPEPARSLVRLITRLMVAQAVAVAVIGLPFSRRQLSSILITAVMVTAVLAVAVLARAGTRPGWWITIVFEVAFILYGLSRFFFARYLGGTLFAILTVGALLHPAVARAYGAASTGTGGRSAEEAGLSEAGEAFGG